MYTEIIRILQQHYPIPIDIENRVIPQKSKDRPIKEKGPHPKRSAWNVHKFGGSSFESADSYSFIASLINKFDGKNLVVVSALSGVTNQLYNVCRRAKLPEWELSDEWLNLISRISSTIKDRLGSSQSGFKETKRFLADLLYLHQILSSISTASEEDQENIIQLVVGYGEIWSARLLTQTLRDDKHRAAAFLDAREVLVVDQQGPKIDVSWDITKENLKKWFYNCRYCDVLIVTGFIARNLNDLPVTLKRNGSDFSATIFSVLTKANSVTIWKDVDGMFTADPKKNPDAKFIPVQTFEEAEDASRRGAFVIQADCIEPAKLHNIPIYLRNCFKLECPGTRIGTPLTKTVQENSSVEKINDAPVDHLMESIQTLPDPSPSSEQIYPLCSDSETVSRPHADDHTILEIIV
jgi:aspartokinase/homoserine dehydrogenase 1